MKLVSLSIKWWWIWRIGKFFFTIVFRFIRILFFRVFLFFISYRRCSVAYWLFRWIRLCSAFVYIVFFTVMRWWWKKVSVCYEMYYEFNWIASVIVMLIRWWSTANTLRAARCWIFFRWGVSCFIVLIFLMMKSIVCGCLTSIVSVRWRK